MAIPLVDLRAQYASIKDEIDSAIGYVLARARFVGGEEVVLLEREFANFCGVREGVGVGSGTDAIFLALKALGVGQGDEVITTPFTFSATAEAIVHTGARPVFVDIDPTTYNIDPEKVARAITPRTRAIVVVHLYGRPADMDAINSLAREHGIWVVEDSAQAHGALYRGNRTGSLGDVACFSFYPGKNLGAYGDGGMVVTNYGWIADRVRSLRDHGRKAKYEHDTVGYNSRLDTLQAAVVRVKLRHLDRWNARRRRLASIYRELLGVSGVALPPEDSRDVQQVYHLFVIATPRRAQVRRHLRNMRIDTGIHYPIPLHLQQAYAFLGYGQGSFPASERLAQEVLSLPIYPEMSEEQAVRVADGVVKALRQSL